MKRIGWISFILAVLLLTQDSTTALGQHPLEEPRPRLQYTYTPQADTLYSTPDTPQSQLPAGVEALALSEYSRLVYDVCYLQCDIKTYTYNRTYNTVSDPAEDFDPALDADGDRVIFASDRMGNLDLFSVAIDGSGLIQLTSGSNHEYAPDVGPDGRIVFQGEVTNQDGTRQSEVFIYDNGAITQLTNHPDYDGMPDWSPDGSRIAFISRRTGGYRVYTIRPDGSELIQISNLPYSARPAWSWSGDYLMFDADSDNDGWQELWRIGSDGSGAVQLLKPIANYDLWSGDYAQGDTSFSYSALEWIYYYGQWYIKNAWLYNRNMNSSYSDLINSNGVFSSDFGTIEPYPPQVSLHSLAAVMPTPVNLVWTVADGQSGMGGLDIQYRENNSDWVSFASNQMYPSNSTPVAGFRGGSQITFRLRGRDRAGNFSPWSYASTTIEALPPVVDFKPLPAYLHVDTPQVRWDGYDQGGSGIEHYRLEYRQVGDTAWLVAEDQIDESRKDTLFRQGQSGQTYQLRLAGVDRAGNETLTAGQTTTIYGTHLSGRILGPRGTPLNGLRPQLNTTPLNPDLSAENGSYGLYLAPAAGNWQAQVNAPGFGSHSAWQFSAQPALIHDFVLPPPDDLVRNGGFEGNLQPGWQVQGNLAYNVNGLVHSGAGGLQVGSALFGAQPQSIPVNENLFSSKYLVDGLGQGHLLSHDNMVLSYRRIASNGELQPVEWSVPMIQGAYFDAILTLDDTLLILWSNAQTGYNLTQRSAGGAWQTQTDVIEHARTFVRLNRGPGNRLYAMILGEGTRIYEYIPGAGWLLTLEEQNYLHESQFLVAGDGTLHLLLTNYEKFPSHYCEVRYLQRNSAGVWSAASTLYSQVDCYYLRIVAEVDAQNTLHTFVYRQEQVYYNYLPSQGNWQPGNGVGLGGAPVYSVSIENPDEPTLVWSHWSLNRILWRKKSGGVWGTEQEIPGSQKSYGYLHSATLFGVTRVVWWQHDPSNSQMYLMYALQTPQGWQLQRISEFGSSALVEAFGPFVQDRNGGLHFSWSQHQDDQISIFHSYHEAGQAEERHLSLSQRLSIPAESHAPTLSLLYRLDNATLAPGGGMQVLLTPALSSTLTQTLALNSSPLQDGWSHGWADLSAWQGQSVTLTLALYQPARAPMLKLALDEVSIGSVYPDLNLKGNCSPLNPQPGDEIVCNIEAGNYGPLAAGSGKIELVLPPEVSLVKSNRPPKLSPGLASWSFEQAPALGSLPKLQVTLRLSSEAAGYRTLPLLWQISTLTPEIYQDNNRLEISLQDLRLSYLPLVRR